MGLAKSMGEVIVATAATVTRGGNKKAIEVNSERSESWQQDTAQVIIPGMSCPQSM